MSYIKTKGIVIKEVKTGESDKIITILTSDGRLSVSAKKSRTGSKNSAASQFLCYSDFMLFKGKGMPIVNTCDLIHSFYEIRNDISLLTYAAHMSELALDVATENQPSHDILRLFLNTLYIMSKNRMPIELLISIFELRVISLTGYRPNIENCVICNDEKLEFGGFNFTQSGFTCKSDICKKTMNTICILPATAAAIRYILSSHIEELFKFSLSKESIVELRNISLTYLCETLDKKYCKLDFLKQL